MKGSWRTTVCAVIAAGAGGVAAANIDPMVTKVALAIATFATSAGLYLARDNKVTSEEALGSPPSPRPSPPGEGATKLPLLFAGALGLALMFVGSGCALDGLVKNADGSVNPEKVATLKQVFRNDVSAAAALASNDPKVRLYLEKAQPAICDLSAKKQFGPSQVDAVLKGVYVKELQSPWVLFARGRISNAYALIFSQMEQTKLPPDGWAAGIIDELCNGMTDGLAGQ